MRFSNCLRCGRKYSEPILIPYCPKCCEDDAVRVPSQDAQERCQRLSDRIAGLMEAKDAARSTLTYGACRAMLDALDKRIAECERLRRQIDPNFMGSESHG